MVWTQEYQLFVMCDRLKVIFGKTAGGGDWHFDYLSRSHLVQSQVHEESSSGDGIYHKRHYTKSLCPRPRKIGSNVILLNLHMFLYVRGTFEILP